jgi:PilZ domain
MEATQLSGRRVRHSVRIPCQVVRERDFKLVGRHVLNLSKEGMLVLSDRPVLTGEQVLLTLKVPGTTSTWLDAEAVVTRVVHNRRPDDEGRALGLSFTWVAPQAAYMLEQQLAWFREAAPRRVPMQSQLWRSLYGAASA